MKKHIIKYYYKIIFYALLVNPLFIFSQQDSKDISACDTLNKVIELFSEGKYSSLYKSYTERKTDEYFLYDYEYQAVYPIQIFTKSLVLKAINLEPAVFTVRYIFEGDLGEATEIYNILKPCFSGWDVEEDLSTFEEELDVIDLFIYNYRKDGVKVQFFIKEALLFSEIDLKISKY